MSVSRKQQHAFIQAFTLIEVLMTLLLAVILAAIAYPSYRSVMQNTRVTAVTNDFMSSLAYARAEALKRNQSVSICAAVDNRFLSCGQASDWLNGWIIFIDPNHTGKIATPADRLKIYSALTSGAIISTAIPYISYNRSGFLAAGAGAFTVTVAGCVGNSARLVTLGVTGRANLTSTACTF